MQDKSPVFFIYFRAMDQSTFPDFKIEPKGTVSQQCISMGLYGFHELCLYVSKLPYGRNSDKNNPLIVLNEKLGTCGTKHALLRYVADEHNRQDITLSIGIFRMNGHNTPKVKNTLEDSGLEYIPEAHNYLRYKGKILDFTGPGFDPVNYENDILDDISIRPEQISEFKVDYHKKFLGKWLAENPRISMTENELWLAREKCISRVFRFF
jgi:hypothetical protein